jgi:adenylate cyclase
MERLSSARRLAAVISADVVGYSRLMQEDDQATLRALTERRGLFAAQVEAAGGRIVNAPGDSVLAEFASVVSAVQCAVNIQRAIEEINSGLPESRRMSYRVGVNIGDVLADSAGIYGDGVNIAAQLESLAPAGGICASQAVRDQVRNRLALQFEDLGEQAVKNIAEPVRVFRVIVDAVPEAQVAAATAAKPPAHPLAEPWSIAVLPFTNMTRDPEQEYFADGMVEDITTALARTGQFFVIARNSSFVYKGRAVDIKQVGRELGVRYVLEGSVRKAGRRIRISGQLIEAESGSHMWADSFDGALEDVFDLQDRITESVVWAIVPSVERAEIKLSRVKPTSNLQAYALVLRALPGIMPGASKAQKDEASMLLDRALQLDPRYSLAKGLGAFACMYRVIDGQGDAQDVKGGLRLADEALADHQDNPMTLAFAAYALATLGYRVQGVTVMGFQEGLDAAERAVRENPKFATAHRAKTIALAYLGRIGEAKLSAARLLELAPEFTVSRYMSVNPMRDPKHRKKVAGLLRAAGVPS